MALELLFLGCGTSAGVPMIACDCAVCRSDDPKDARSRPSVLVRYRDEDAKPQAGSVRPPHESGRVGERARAVDPDADGWRQLLIDTAPELRLQMIRHGVRRIDGVFFTHAHADHIFGLDDVRRFNAVMGTAIDLYAEQATLDLLAETFRYVFESHKNLNQSFIPELRLKPVEVGRPLALHGATWTPLRLMHGRQPILGFRIDHGGASIAYCTDVSAFPAETLAAIRGVDVLVIDALRQRPHPTHLTVDDAVRHAQELGAKQAFLTHMAHDLKYSEVEPTLPEGVHMAYDGLLVRCDGPN